MAEPTYPVISIVLQDQCCAPDCGKQGPSSEFIRLVPKELHTDKLVQIFGRYLGQSVCSWVCFEKLKRPESLTPAEKIARITKRLG